MAGEKYLNESANSDSCPNFGLPVSTSIAGNSVVTAKFVAVEKLGTKAVGKLRGPITTVVIGSVGVVDTYRNGTTGDVVVQTAGIDGAVGGYDWVKRYHRGSRRSLLWGR